MGQLQVYITLVLTNYVGTGNYYIRHNSLWLGGDPPKVKNLLKGEAFIIQHREYIGDVLAGGSAGSTNSPFVNQTIALNPGLLKNFPWLAQIAVNYEQYSWNGLVFEFKSLQSDSIAPAGGSSSALGTVIMSTNYNAAATSFTNKQQMLEAEYSSDCKPSCSFFHPIECKGSLTPLNKLYVRAGPIIAGTDPRLNDHGIFQIASQGCQSGNMVLGELWATYEVKFYKPILGGIAAGFDIPTDHYQMTNPLAATPLGTPTAPSVPMSSIGTTQLATAPYNVITFPNSVYQGTFLVTWTIIAASGATLVYPALTFQNCTLGRYFSTIAGPDNVSIWTSPNAGATNQVTMTMIFIVTLPGTSPTVGVPSTITWGVAGTMPTGNGFGDLWITQINTGVIT